MMRSLVVFAGILFLSLNTYASFNDKDASDITNPNRMTGIDFRTAVSKLTLEAFNNFNSDKQTAIRERAKNANLKLPFEVSIEKTPSKTTETLSKQPFQKIVPIFPPKISENNTNEPKKESIKQNENPSQDIEKMLETYYEKYEYLNKKAPLWIHQMDENINKSSSLLTDVAKSLNENTNNLTDNEKLNTPLDENIKIKFTQATNILKMFNAALPEEPEYGFPDLTFSETHNNIGILFARAKAYYIFTLARYKKTALKLNNDIKSMHEKLNQFINEYKNAKETKNLAKLQILENTINIELNSTNQDPIFKMLDTK